MIDPRESDRSREIKDATHIHPASQVMPSRDDVSVWFFFFLVEEAGVEARGTLLFVRKYFLIINSNYTSVR